MATEYQVRINRRAERDIAAIRNYIARDKPRAGAKWVRGCERRIRSLAILPRRYEVIPEAEVGADELRHLLFGNYRIVYRVEEDVVTVMRVIHASQLFDLDSLY